MVRETAKKSGGRKAAPEKRLGEQGVIGVLRLANRISLDVAAVLRPHALTLSQYNALRILRGASDAGATCGQIAERMLTRDPDITRLMDRLVLAGWATRERDGADRRVVTSRITQAGLELLAGLDGEIAAFDRGVFARIDDARLTQLVEILEEVLAQ
jgi:MarR family transcriptional regulator, organic hydroperoxide resistance regulator